MYVHVPFCAAICPYCDFSVLIGDARKRATYLEALASEARSRMGEFGPFDTLYLGGGTPSALDGEALERVLGCLRESFDLAPSAWTSLEANPEDVFPARVAYWRQLGVHTLSLGVQSFSAAELAFLGRKHTPERAVEALRLAQEAGFPIVSLDLIYGLPGQTLAQWRRNLETAIALGPEHLSCYQLTVHERTAFGRLRDRGALEELGEDDQAEMFYATHRILEDAGYAGYEVSSFARSEASRSRHNSKYWRHVPYLGLGPSAHSFDGAERWWNEPRLGRWAQHLAQGRSPVAGRERLARSTLAFERLMLGLRTREGIDLPSFERVYGVALEDANRERFARWEARGWVRLSGGRLRPTLSGLAIAEHLALDIELPAGPGEAAERRETRS